MVGGALKGRNKLLSLNPKQPEESFLHILIF